MVKPKVWIPLTITVISLILACWVLIMIYTSPSSSTSTTSVSNEDYVLREELGRLAFKDSVINEDLNEPVTLEKGGLGSSNVAEARTVLQLGSLALSSVTPQLDTIFHTPGNFLFTVPVGVTQLRVRMCGGGGGGGGGGAGGWAIDVDSGGDYSSIFPELSNDADVTQSAAHSVLQVSMQAVNDAIARGLKNDLNHVVNTAPELFDDIARNNIGSAINDISLSGQLSAAAYAWSDDVTPLYSESASFFEQWSRTLHVAALARTLAALRNTGPQGALYAATVISFLRYDPPKTMLVSSAIAVSPHADIGIAIVRSRNAISVGVNPLDANVDLVEILGAEQCVLAALVAGVLFGVSAGGLHGYTLTSTLGADTYGTAFNAAEAALQEYSSTSNLVNAANAYTTAYALSDENDAEAKRVRVNGAAICLCISMTYNLLHPTATIHGMTYECYLDLHNTLKSLNIWDNFYAAITSEEIEIKLNSQKRDAQYAAHNFNAGGGGGGGSSGEISGYLSLTDDPTVISVVPGEQLLVTVGSGGIGGDGGLVAQPQPTAADPSPLEENNGGRGNAGGSSFLRRGDIELVSRPGGRGGLGGSFGVQGGAIYSTEFKDESLRGGNGGSGGPALYFSTPGEGGLGGYDGYVDSSYGSTVSTNRYGNGGSGGTYNENEYPFDTSTVKSEWFPTDLTRSSATAGSSGLTAAPRRGGSGGVSFPGYLSRFGGGGNGGVGGETRGAGHTGQTGQPGLVWLQLVT